MALAEDHPDYIPKEIFAEALRKYLLPGYIEKLRKELDKAQHNDEIDS